MLTHDCEGNVRFVSADGKPLPQASSSSSGGLHVAAVAADLQFPEMPIACVATPHRDHLLPQARCPISDLAMVARLVPRKEMFSNPKARERLDFEWARLRSNPTWDEENPREWADVAAEA